MTNVLASQDFPSRTVRRSDLDAMFEKLPHDVLFVEIGTKLEAALLSLSVYHEKPQTIYGIPVKWVPNGISITIYTETYYEPAQSAVTGSQSAVESTEEQSEEVPTVKESKPTKSKSERRPYRYKNVNLSKTNYAILTELRHNMAQETNKVVTYDDVVSELLKRADYK